MHLLPQKGQDLESIPRLIEGGSVIAARIRRGPQSQPGFRP
jgi:hypothetical protein